MLNNVKMYALIFQNLNCKLRVIFRLFDNSRPIDQISDAIF